MPETLALAKQVDQTEVHLVGAYPVTPINIAIELPDFDPGVYNDAIRGQHLDAGDQYGNEGEERHPSTMTDLQQRPHHNNARNRIGNGHQGGVCNA